MADAVSDPVSDAVTVAVAVAVADPAVPVLNSFLVDVNLNDRVRFRASVVADSDLPVRRGNRRKCGAQKSETHKPHRRDSSSHFVSLHTAGSN
jgi:hypothetical protein